MNAFAPNLAPAEEPLDEAALAFIVTLEAKATHLRRRLGVAERWTLAKAIAAAAIALELGRGYTADAALACASRAAAAAYRLGRGPLKTRGSEARALLAFGLPRERRVALGNLKCDERLDGIVAALLDVSLPEALARRAEALAGSRGGRPAESSVVAEVKALIRQDQAGDPGARAELVALSQQLRLWTDRIVQRASVRARAGHRAARC